MIQAVVNEVIAKPQEDPSVTEQAVSKRVESHRNNFNAIRLVLAALVIFCHSFELIDGNRLREPFSILTGGKMSLGEFAVNGFFLISGYLVTASWLRSRDWRDYLKKRVLRIYPGYLAAMLICIAVVGPLAVPNVSEYVHHLRPVHIIASLVQLRNLDLPNVFLGTYYPDVNGPVYTVHYEFLCYLALIGLGIFGILRKERMLIAIAVALYALLQAQVNHVLTLRWHGLIPVLGDPALLPQFGTYFLAGICFYQFRSRIVYSNRGVWIAGAILLLFSFGLHQPNLAMPIVGAYLLFAFAFWPNSKLQNIGTQNDLSYGIYLYGWPLQKLLLWYKVTSNAWLLSVIAVSAASLLAFLSWRIVEQPCLQWKRSK